jgi:hypothetical protein
MSFGQIDLDNKRNFGDTKSMPAKPTGLLTQRGVLTRDLEIFGESLWGPVATFKVAFGPYGVSLETEILEPSPETA